MSTVDSVALGNFDGMHLGHRALFERLGKRGAIAVIEHYRATLTPGLYRAKFIERPLHFFDFERIRDLSAARFVERLTQVFPALQRIVVGEDFGFGAGREGNCETLHRLFGGEVVVVPEVKREGEGVHTRHIRRMIQEGDVQKAAQMLGREYEVWGEVVAGQGLGNRELVPTINLECGRFLLPKEGVYATETCLGEECLPSVTFVGHRATTDGGFAVETHVLGRTLVPAGIPWKISIRWLRRIRANRKFDTLEALKRQIEQDIGEAYER